MFGLLGQTNADTLSVEYKSFYSHVSKLNNDETSALQFAFGFLNIQSKELCTIRSAQISTEKVQIPIIVSDEMRFTVPSDKVLKLARAMVVIDLLEASNICDMSVQLETKSEYLKDTYTSNELQMLLTQYAAFFDDMGGFLSFMMPKVSGIRMLFQDKDLSVTLTEGLIIKQGELHIDSSDIPLLTSLKLPTPPVRITAITTD